MQHIYEMPLPEWPEQRVKKLGPISFLCNASLYNMAPPDHSEKEMYHSLLPVLRQELMEQLNASVK